MIDRNGSFCEYWPILFELGGITFFPESRVLWGTLPKAASTSLKVVLGAAFGRMVTRKGSPDEYARILFDPDVFKWRRITSIRDPFSRTVSLFREFSADGETFAEFCDSWDLRIARDAAFRRHSFPFSIFEMIAPEFRIVFEDLDQSVGELLKAFGKEPIEIPHLRRSRGSSAAVYYNTFPETADFVRETYAADFGRFYDANAID